MNLSDHHPMQQRINARYGSTTIHPEGLYRWGEFADRIPFSRETWRKRVLSHRAPAPIRIGGACTAWRGSEILAWLENPDGYGQPHGKNNPTPD